MPATELPQTSQVSRGGVTSATLGMTSCGPLDFQAS
jgi:hypothetical protein